MAYWFTDEQWKEYISKENAMRDRLKSQLCVHMLMADVRRDIDLELWASNQASQNGDDNGLKSGWFFYDSEYGTNHEYPIKFCPWCGVSLPDIPELHIGA